MNIKSMIEKTRGRIFRVVFVKRTNGEVRRMLARTGVRKGITGQGLKFEPSAHSLKIVWDLGKRNYRAIPLDAVTEFSCGKMKWKAA